MALFGELYHLEPNLKITYIARRNSKVFADLARAYPKVTVVNLPYSILGALKTILPLFKKRSVVIAPPPRDVHPFIIKLLSLAFYLRGDEVVGFKDKPAKSTSRDITTRASWHPFNKTVRY